MSFLMQEDNKITKEENKTTNKRTTARLAAVQAIYQMDVGDTTLEEILVEFSAFRLGKEIEGEQYLPADSDFFSQIVKGVIKNQLEIDPLIDASLNDEWHVSKIDSTLRAILRAGAFELLGRKDIPAKVVINEYVDIAKSFFDADVSGMVNGVLDNIAKSHLKDSLAQNPLAQTSELPNK
jgi:N utilization substance protein B